MTAYEFDRFRLDPVRRLVLKDGEILPLAPKSFDVLLVLIEHRGRMVAYNDLIRSVWGATASARTVDNLKDQVSRLRKALGDDRAKHRFIVTVPLEGYTFVAPVLVADSGLSKSGISSPVPPVDQHTAFALPTSAHSTTRTSCTK